MSPPAGTASKKLPPTSSQRADHPGGPERFGRAGDDVGLVEQDAAHLRVRGQDRGQERPVAAAHVHHRARPREVVPGDDRVPLPE